MDPRLVLGSLTDPVSEKFQATRFIPVSSLVKELDETGMPLRFGPLLLQSGLNASTKLPRFEDHHVSCMRYIQERGAVTRETITRQRSENKLTANLTAMPMAIERQGHVAAGLSSKSVQPLPPTIPKEEEALDTAVPVAHKDLSYCICPAFRRNEVHMQRIRQRISAAD